MHKFYIVYFCVNCTIDYHLFDDYIVLVSSLIVFTLPFIPFYTVLHCTFISYEFVYMLSFLSYRESEPCVWI